MHTKDGNVILLACILNKSHHSTKHNQLGVLTQSQLMAQLHKQQLPCIYKKKEKTSVVAWWLHWISSYPVMEYSLWWLHSCSERHGVGHSWPLLAKHLRRSPDGATFLHLQSDCDHSQRNGRRFANADRLSTHCLSLNESLPVSTN